jgi:regulator of Ty1 transposition protein 109
MSATTSLKDKLTSALPSGFQCKIRYIRTQAKDCDALFPAFPGGQPERTRLTSHLLTVSVDPANVPSNSPPIPAGSADVLSFAIEVFVYTTKYLTTIFVSKIDSTSYIPRQRPSPIQRTVTAFLEWLKDSQLQKVPTRKVVISLFARAQAQYIFPGSSDDRGGAKYNKHVLDDRQLIKWWVRTIDPIISNSKSSETTYQGHLTVPGYEGNELKRSFTPTSADPTKPNWLPGNPLVELARARGLPEHAPTRCLLPRFPDDPKARFVLELDEEVGLSQESQATTASPSKRKGRWTSVRDLKSFWDAMEFRQECSSGRVVGFLWLVITPPGSDDADIDETEPSSQISLADMLDGSAEKEENQPKQPSRDRPKKKRPLTGPIIPRPPRLKGGSSNLSQSSNRSTIGRSDLVRGLVVTKDGYDKAVQTLLSLDFANLPIAVKSTKKWIFEVSSICGLGAGEDFSISITGTSPVEITVVAGTHSSTTTEGSGSGGGGPVVNDLAGMVRKKRSATTTVDGLSTGEQTGANSEAPGVNVLGSNTIRKKAKPSA